MINIKNIVLKNKRLRLQILKPNNVNTQYVNWLNDDEVNKFLETRHKKQNKKLITSYVKKIFILKNTFLFGIHHIKSSKYIGNIKIGPIKKNHLLADIALFIGEKSFWGKGIATDAIKIISKFGFDNLGLVKLNAISYLQNKQSIKAFLKAGFKKEGHRKKHYILNHNPADIIEMGLTKNDFKEK